MFILAQGLVHPSRKGMVPRAHGGVCVTHGGPGIRKQGQCQVLLYSLFMAQFHQSPLALQVPELSSWMVQSACRENAMQKWLECALGELQPTPVPQTKAFYASRTYSGTHWLLGFWSAAVSSTLASPQALGLGESHATSIPGAPDSLPQGSAAAIIGMSYFSYTHTMY